MMGIKDLVGKQSGLDKDVSGIDVGGVISDGMTKLVKSKELKDTAGVLKELLSTDDNNPLKGLKYLKDAGMDLGSTVAAQGQVVEGMKTLASEERIRAEKATERADEKDLKAQGLQNDMMKMYLDVIEKQRQESQTRYEELKEETKKQKPETMHVMQDILSQYMAKRVSQDLEQSQQPVTDPLQQLLTYEQQRKQLREVFGGNSENYKEQVLNNPADMARLEALKLVMEDDREREKMRIEQKREENKSKSMEDTGNTLKEMLPFLVELYANRATGVVTPVAHTQDTEKVVDSQDFSKLQCSKCLKSFSIESSAVKAICPYCKTQLEKTPETPGTSGTSETPETPETSETPGTSGTQTMQPSTIQTLANSVSKELVI